MVQAVTDDNEPPSPVDGEIYPKNDNTSPNSLKMKLEETLNTAEELLNKIQLQISKISLREKMLKDTIANGR